MTCAECCDGDPQAFIADGVSRMAGIEKGCDGAVAPCQFGLQKLQI